MNSPITLLEIIRYYDDKPWDSEHINNPTWENIEHAIRQMDDYYFPIVSLSCSGYRDDDDNFEVIGGNGQYAMFQRMGGTWEYTDPAGSDQDVHLWKSDQGYCCQERHVCHDVEQVLRIVKAYFETGVYDGLNEIA